MQEPIYYTPTQGEGYVYVLTNPLKGDEPFYVGLCHPETKSKKRAFVHLNESEARNRHKHNTIRTIEEHGHEVGVRVAWTGSDRGKALWVEKFFIALYGRRDKMTGVLTNLTDGGEGNPGHIPSPETIRARTAWLIGRKDSEDTIRRRADANRGRKNTPEARRRMSDAAERRYSTADGKAHLERMRSARTDDSFKKVGATKRKIRPVDAAAIRDRIARGEARAMIAREFGVGTSTIHRVVNRTHGY